MKFLVLPDYSNETTAQHFPVLLLIYIALSRTTASLRASSPFGEVVRSHAREARERRHECEGRVSKNHLTVHNFSANGILLRQEGEALFVYIHSK